MGTSPFWLLPALPINPRWIDGHPGFESDDAAVVRASLRLILAAFGGEPPGCLRGDERTLGDICGETPEFMRANWNELLHGFAHRGPLMAHEGVSAFCADVDRQLGGEIAKLRAAIFASSLGVGAKSKRASTRRSVETPLPEGFGLDDGLREWLMGQGVRDGVEQHLLMENFLSYARAKSARYVDWPAAFRQNVTRRLLDRGARPAGSPGVPGFLAGPAGRAAQSGSALVRAREHMQQRTEVAPGDQGGFDFARERAA